MVNLVLAHLDVICRSDSETNLTKHDKIPMCLSCFAEKTKNIIFSTLWKNNHKYALLSESIVLAKFPKFNLNK